MKTVDGRWKLRNLDLPQRLLVITILATVGGGYLAALANVFATHAGADGHSTINLEDFPRVLREEGLGALVAKVQDSLGMQDVVRHYHGSGGWTGLETVLEGSMKDKISEKLLKDEGKSDENFDRAEALRLMLANWSKLPEEARKRTYEEGAPTNDQGIPDFTLRPAANAVKKKGEAEELAPVVKDALDAYCARCHKAGGVDKQAAPYPLDTFAAVNKYCGVDEGVSAKALAMTTHVHLLGFSVLFAMTGFLFSMTEFPLLVRAIFVPFTLALQVVEISCWWLAKLHVFFAEMIFFLGPLIGLGLLIQILGVFFDVAFRRPERIV